MSSNKKIVETIQLNFQFYEVYFRGKRVSRNTIENFVKPKHLGSED